MLDNTNVTNREKCNFVNHGLVTKENEEFFKTYNFKEDPLYKDDYTYSEEFTKDFTTIKNLLVDYVQLLGLMNVTIWSDDMFDLLGNLTTEIQRVTEETYWKIYEDLDEQSKSQNVFFRYKEELENTDNKGEQNVG